jgi:putative methionine-R-sulfoxide reductase with GAF domain
MNETPVERPYDAVVGALSATGSRDQRMRAVVDALWHALRDHGVSWVGFYIERSRAPDEQRLELGPCRDRPACSPIGLYGVCGQALRSRQARIVADVASLGEDYVACDPRDRSEIAVPLIGADGACWGVLDIDSHEIGAFDESDAEGLSRVLRAAGLL